MTNITNIMEEARTIAVVGMSNKPDRDSHEVGVYLSRFYKVIPVNPNHDEIAGMKCYPDLESIPEPVDIVDVFQRSENVAPFVEPAIRIGAKCFWMQLGIQSEEATRRLEGAGVFVVADRCTKIEHARLG
ncbi:MAG: CoA-binding protein [Gammaproteobacteria bacterium]|nr:CoA-binding protein [Gammaproteobacteria bacterium]